MAVAGVVAVTVTVVVVVVVAPAAAVWRECDRRPAPGSDPESDRNSYTESKCYRVSTNTTDIYWKLCKVMGVNGPCLNNLSLLPAKSSMDDA